MSFLNDAKDFCYMQPGIPQETLEKVAELVDFDGNLTNVQLIELTVARFWGAPFKMATLVTQDMAYFKYPMHDAFTLKLHSDTDIRFDAASMEISFNGQKLYTTSSNETFGFLKALIAKLPANDKSIISQFERISAPHIYCRGQIPKKKLQVALAEYGEAVQAPSEDDIIMLIDDTFKGKADNHLLITKDWLYIDLFLKRPMQRMLYSNTVIAYLPPEKDKSICTLTINSVPVCSIYSEESAKLLVATLQELQKGCPASDDSCMGIFEQIIHQEISVKPYIPRKFISNALANFKLDIPADEILVMVDNTLADSFKNGLILTKNCLYVKALLKDTYAIELSRETDVQLDSEKQIVVNGKPIFKFTSSDLNGPQTFVRGLQCLISTLEGTQKSALKMKISKIVHGRFHKAPHIPQYKLLNAIKEYAQDAKPEEVLCLFDDTLRENGKAGVLLTKDTLYVCTRVLQLKRVTKASFKDMLSMFLRKKITISQNDEIAYKGSDLLINGDIVCSLDNDGKEIVPQLVELLDLMKNCQ